MQAYWVGLFAGISQGAPGKGLVCVVQHSSASLLETPERPSLTPLYSGFPKTTHDSKHRGRVSVVVFGASACISHFIKQHHKAPAFGLYTLRCLCFAAEHALSKTAELLLRSGSREWENHSDIQGAHSRLPDITQRKVMHSLLRCSQTDAFLAH